MDGGRAERRALSASDDGGVALYSGGTWTDITAEIPTAMPATSYALTDGELHFCGGTWAVRVVTSGTAGIYGYGGSTLDGGEQGSVVHVDGEGAVTIAGLTLTGGRALTATSFGGMGGGGVLCDRAASTLAIEDVTISGNAGANYGGGLYVSGCTTTLDNVTVSANTADSGAGIWAGATAATTLTITNSTIQGNTASWSGGGLYVDSQVASSTVHLTDTLVSGNTAGARGGGAAVAEASVLTCTATGGSRSGLVGNTGTAGGGGVYLGNFYGGEPSFTSAGCDFGVDGSADDNAPEDLFLYPGPATVNYGDGATFSCGSASCW